jgi:hypothetical protein
MKLIEGKQYRVAVQRAHLDRLKPIAAWTWTNEVMVLPVGSVITYDGARSGVGSDPITETHWIAPDGSRGWTFSPSTWGWPTKGSLIVVDEESTT